MKAINPNRIKFYEFLDGNISTEKFEEWIYENKELENNIPKDVYIDLISYNFKSHDLIPYVKSIVRKQFDWKEFEIWRTINLLEKIKHNKIEIVLATRKMRQLYFEQEDELTRPLISIGLAIGYESELDRCPVESEYHKWNSEALKKQLEPVEWYRKDILEFVDQELSELLNPELKTIDLGLIVNTKNLHDTFVDSLKFPDFYGYNWDAFWDAITGLVEMPNTLILKNWGKFAQNFPKDSQILETIIKDYNNEQTEKRIIIKAGNTVYSK